MWRRIRLSILILCAILFQGIVAATQENINESSDRIRKQRAFGQIPYLNSNPVGNSISYLVSIRNGQLHKCAGTILTSSIVLTAAHCVFNGGTTLRVQAGSAQREFGTFHTVKNLRMHPGFRPNILENDLALLYVVPPINMGKGKGIPLYNGYVSPGDHAIFSSWGCTVLVGKNHTIHPKEIQLRPVTFINPSTCRLNEEHLCTRNAWTPQHNCLSSSGGPLTIDGQLVGIMSVPKGQNPNKNNHGEFVNLTHPAYKQWIISTVHQLQTING